MVSAGKEIRVANLIPAVFVPLVYLGGSACSESAFKGSAHGITVNRQIAAICGRNMRSQIAPSAAFGDGPFLRCENRGA
jgi:hypothetical protein